jgi:predicted nucleic-acid-binding Zn-ribbon protein
MPTSWSVPEQEVIASLTHDELSEHMRLARVNPGHYRQIHDRLEAEMESRSPTLNFKCMKCGHAKFEEHQIRATRSWLSSFFGVETAQYRAVVCARCKFTEFYQGNVPLGQQAIDAIFGR